MPLERVLEPEVMDTLEEATDYNEMDHREVNRKFVDDLLAAGEISGEVLDLGTGTALIPIELCQRHEDCRVMAVDMAVHMLDLARYNIEAETLIERIMLEQIDAKEMPFDDDRFDVVMSNSIVHHIPDPFVALSEAVRVTKPGGLIYIRDLMRPEDDATVQQLVDTYAADENNHARQMFDDSLRAALSLDEIRVMVVRLGFVPESVSATSDRHWTWSSFKVLQDDTFGEVMWSEVDMEWKGNIQFIDTQIPFTISFDRIGLTDDDKIDAITAAKQFLALMDSKWEWRIRRAAFTETVEATKYRPPGTVEELVEQLLPETKIVGLGFCFCPDEVPHTTGSIRYKCQPFSQDDVLYVHIESDLSLGDANFG